MDAAAIYGEAVEHREKAQQLQRAAEDQVLVEFSQGKLARDLADELGVVESRIWQMLRAARKRAGVSASRTGQSSDQ